MQQHFSFLLHIHLLLLTIHCLNSFPETHSPSYNRYTFPFLAQIRCQLLYPCTYISFSYPDILPHILTSDLEMLPSSFPKYTARPSSGAPNDGFLLNTLKTFFQSAFRYLEMHSKWHYKHFICSVILGVYLSLFEIITRVYSCLHYIFESENFRFPLFTKITLTQPRLKC